MAAQTSQAPSSHVTVVLFSAAPTADACRGPCCRSRPMSPSPRRSVPISGGYLVERRYLRHRAPRRRPLSGGRRRPAAWGGRTTDSQASRRACEMMRGDIVSSTRSSAISASPTPGLASWATPRTRCPRLARSNPALDLLSFWRPWSAPDCRRRRWVDGRHPGDPSKARRCSVLGTDFNWRFVNKARRPASSIGNCGALTGGTRNARPNAERLRT